eukprot:gene8924-9876_t
MAHSRYSNTGVVRCNRFMRGAILKYSDINSLRRRASSLDYLPSPTGSPVLSPKSPQYSPMQPGKPMFHRSTSLSQRSPFRKRVAFGELESNINALKDQRPRSLKRFKNILDALFDAIQRQDIAELRKILQMPDVKINDLNADNFTPLDMALLKGEAEMAQLLLAHGATENPSFLLPETRSSHLESLIKQADKKVNDLTALIVNCTSDVKESERQLREWEWRLYMLRIFQNGFLNLDAPSECPVVSAAPLSDRSVIVIVTPERRGQKEIITRYKVEWSTDENFKPIEGEKLVMDMRSLQYTIDGLEKSKRWYIRVRAGNMKGFGPAIYPDPPYIVPSSWHEVNNSKPSYIGCKEQLAGLLQEFFDYKANSEKSCPVPSSTSSVTSHSANRESPRGGRKTSVFRTVSKYTNLVFHSAPKLLKRMKCRGIYLASLLYNEDDDRVLVTLDENLPVVEVDDTYSKTFQQEFYWLAKVSCTWDDVQQMFHDSSRGHSSHSINVRRKLLHAAMVLQNATGVQDLGFLYHRAFKDAHGSMLLLTVNAVKKSACGTRLTTMKWVPVSRLQKKTNNIQDSISPERLIPSIQEQVLFHRRSRVPVSRGLYLGYLKLRAAMDSLSIVVPDLQPNLLPHVKIRDIPNVTKEDWMWIHSLGTEQEAPVESSPSCAAFESKLRAATKKLFSNLGIDEEYSNQHRLYTKEVIELNEDLLFILILPPIEDICTNPGQSDLFHALSGYTAVPVQTFEMISTNTYQPEVMRSYGRVSSLLEMESFFNLQMSREALSLEESKMTKEKQVEIAEMQSRVDASWHDARWVLDTIQTAREKHVDCSVHVGYLFNLDYVYKPLPVVSPVSRKSRVESVYIKNGLSLKNGCRVKVYGTAEIGICNNEFAEIYVNRDTTVQDIIIRATQSIQQYAISSAKDCFELTSDNFSYITLVALSGSKERCLRDDLKLLSVQNPWERGQLFLRLKKEAFKASKLSKSTSV